MANKVRHKNNREEPKMIEKNVTPEAEISQTEEATELEECLLTDVYELIYENESFVIWDADDERELVIIGIKNPMRMTIILSYDAWRELFDITKFREDYCYESHFYLQGDQLVFVDNRINIRMTDAFWADLVDAVGKSGKPYPRGFPPRKQA